MINSKLFFFFILVLALFTTLFFYFNKPKIITPIVKRLSLENITFIQLPKNDDESFMESLIRGTLIVDNGCIKLRSEDTKSLYTLVFPSSFNIIIENDALVVKHGDKILGQEGNTIEISGGEVSDLSNLNTINHEQCMPPYWVVGAEMRLLK